jgi:hypothetical protein
MAAKWLLLLSFMVLGAMPAHAAIRIPVPHELAVVLAFIGFTIIAIWIIVIFVGWIRRRSQ